jgi:hypothetical protein
MTREEYDALVAQKDSVERQFETLALDICKILKGIGLRNSGEAKITDISGGMASINYLKRASHGSCCGEDWDSTTIPAHWIFGGDWETEHAKQKAEEERLSAEKEAAEKAEALLDEERRDREEFERLKSKFPNS